MMAFPDSFAESLAALPAEILTEAGRQAVQKLAEKGFEVRSGLTPEMADAISSMAQEPSIREYCPKDSSERFSDQTSTERWLSKQRGMFLLLKRLDDGKLVLAGYGWAGSGSNHHVPGGEITFALRVGEIGQGQGLATPFSQLILAASAALYGAQNIWLETWASNGGAVHIYHKIGFATVDEEPGHRIQPDGQNIDDTRIYMSLSNEILARL